jgi:hypothetical protein
MLATASVEKDNPIECYHRERLAPVVVQTIIISVEKTSHNGIAVASETYNIPQHCCRTDVIP